MKPLTSAQRFWIAGLVIGGYLLFGAIASVLFNNMAIALAVLSTMGPLVGWVVKGLFDGPQASGKPNDPVQTKEE
jgi:hypothetical protein